MSYKYMDKASKKNICEIIMNKMIVKYLKYFSSFVFVPHDQLKETIPLI